MGHMDVEETGEDNFMMTDQRFIWSVGMKIIFRQLARNDSFDADITAVLATILRAQLQVQLAGHNE